MRRRKQAKYIIKLTKLVLLLGACLGIASLAVAKLSGSLAPDAIEQRLRPIAEINIMGAGAVSAQPAAAGGGKTPKDIYDTNCKMCHATGLAGAPKLGDKAQWAPRISQGLDMLVKNAITGIRAMPPKGNCLNCTPEDIKATVEYMLKASQ